MLNVRLKPWYQLPRLNEERKSLLLPPAFISSITVRLLTRQSWLNTGLPPTVQRRSQALKSGWAHGDLGEGKEVPQRGEGRSPGGNRLQKPDIYRQFAVVKCFSTQVCCRVSPPSPLPSKNSSDLRKSDDPTRPGQGGQVHGCPPVATLLVVNLLAKVNGQQTCQTLTPLDYHVRGVTLFIPSQRTLMD